MLITVNRAINFSKCCHGEVADGKNLCNPNWLQNKIKMQANFLFHMNFY